MLHTRIPSTLVVALALQSAGCGDDPGDSTDSASSTISTSATDDTTASPPPSTGSTSLDESASGTASESGTTDGVTATTGTSELPPLTTGEPDTMTSGEPDTTTTGESDSTTTTIGQPDSTTTTGEPDTTTTTTTTGEPDTTTSESTTGDALDCSDGVAWTRNILTDAGSTMFEDILADPDGNLLVAGRLWSVADFGGGPVQSCGPEDAFIAKYGPTGDLLWLRTYGDEYEQRARGLALAPDGDILVTGSFRGQIDLGGGPFASAGYDDVFLARLTFRRRTRVEPGLRRPGYRLRRTCGQ
ncbi:hypothetical protein [Nannocystis pusilla]|uniref:hypothetical protein n=1 Tax=Nannocystis pusilla TaxID=889268 RepID=UPI003DA4B4CB